MQPQLDDLMLINVYMLGVYILFVVVSGVVIALLFRLLIASKDREYALILKEKDRLLADQDSIKKSYKEIAEEAVKSAADTVSYYRDKEGGTPLPIVEPVVSESHSPSTAAQRETANIQTMRAKMVVIKKATGQEPRAEPEHAQE